MLIQLRSFLILLGLSALAVTSARGEQAPAANSPVAPLILDGLGKGTFSLDAPWQFHTGDQAVWSASNFDDSGWEQLRVDLPWGEQGHQNYAGFAWYRRHIEVRASDGLPSAQIALLIPHVEDAYELYWNGELIGRDGRLPPYPSYFETTSPPRIFHLPTAARGVLALRVWRAPPLSDDSGRGGGLNGTPLAGSDEAISTQLASINYAWLRSQQFYFSLNLLYGLIALLSLLAWLQDRSQRQLLFMFGFAFSPLLEMLFYGVHLPWPSAVANAFWQPLASIRDICLWYLLLWLLRLTDSRPLMRLTRVFIWLSLGSQVLDIAPYFLVWSATWRVPMQLADAMLILCWIPTGALPLIFVAAAIHRRRPLDYARWAVAIFAVSTGMIQLTRTLAPQGSRFTHWTLADRVEAPLFTVGGNAISLPTLNGTLMLLAIVYAVYRSTAESRHRQTALEQEFKSARELQRVLIPEILPAVIGYALTSAYLPAHEVGGDFFQIVPLEADAAGSTLVIVGDVSGKGLKAAMAVSFIVGAVRALANILPDPGALLSELNQRLIDRLQGGFATCLILRLDVDGACTMASAGHPPAFLNTDEVDAPGAFPLGLIPSVRYEETTIQLNCGDRCTLYTDGLLEARSSSGELYGFDRLCSFLRSRPDAAEAVDEAVRFGQDDDITVVTLTRTAANVTSNPLPRDRQSDTGSRD